MSAECGESFCIGGLLSFKSRRPMRHVPVLARPASLENASSHEDGIGDDGGEKQAEEQPDDGKEQRDDEDHVEGPPRIKICFSCRV